TGNVCGDGVPDGTVETCDDGNLLSCGTCSADCGASQSARAATGSILVTTTAAGTPDGGTFTLGDGTTTVTFELDKNASVTSGNVRVNIGSATTAAEVALAVNNAIDGALGITPSRTAETVSLTNSVGGGANHNGALGNVTIVQGGGLTWTLGGMSAGRGRDCPATTGCASNNDCASRVCTSGSCM
ncbi:MAG: hypothetical protein H6719_37775, partial [Sandaracinaceae bacterium]|nr:hypothetical protein [Sandaracinaceae bacterium]